MKETVVIFVLILGFLALLWWQVPQATPTHSFTASHKAPPTQVATRDQKPPTFHQKRSTKKMGRPSSKPFHTEKKSVSSKQEKVVYGVPVDGFVAKNKNSLAFPVSEKKPEGVRLFLQCLELKKGQTSELSEQECRAIANRPSPSSSAQNLLGTF